MKKLLVKLADKLGYEVRRKQSVVSQIGFNPDYLRTLCQPMTVIDVGVGHGTYPLHHAFPQAHFILIEPLEDYRSSMEKLAGKYDCELVFKAVGEITGDLEINVDTQNLQRSSLEVRTELTTTGNAMEKRTIEVDTLDNIIAAAESWEGPVLLKLDTEGHEIAALRGAQNLLNKVDYAIIETSVAPRFENGYRFEEVVCYMASLGFSVYSFLTLVHPRGEIQPRFADVVFKRI